MRIRRVRTAVVVWLMAVVIGWEAVSSVPKSAVFFGMAVPGQDVRLIAPVAQALGYAPSAFAMFVRLDSPSFTLKALQEISAAGMVPYVTLEPWSIRSAFGNPEVPAYSLRALARGDHDRELAAIGAVLAAYGQPVYLRFAHEMNGHWYPWGMANGNTLAEYGQAWRHAHGVIAPVAPLVQWLWAPAVVQLTRGGVALSALYPGDAYVDLVGATGYSRDPVPVLTVATTFSRTFREIVGFTTKPLVLAEMGASGPQKDQWLASLGAYLAVTPRVAGFMYFNIPSSAGASGAYALEPRDMAFLAASLAEIGDRLVVTTPPG